MKTDNNKNVNKSFNNGFLSKTTGNKMVLQVFLFVCFQRPLQ